VAAFLRKDQPDGCHQAIKHSLIIFVPPTIHNPRVVFKQTPVEMRALAWQTVSIVLALLVSTATAFVPVAVCAPRPLSHLDASAEDDSTPTSVHRRGFLSQTIASVGMVAAAVTSPPQPAQAIGPVKLALEPRSYQAAPCPPSKPIPGEKAMFGMRGLCVTVKADLIDTSPKDLEKVGVYGFVVDAETGNSVLANNPDLR
jgi:hypothetical protein